MAPHQAQIELLSASQHGVKATAFEKKCVDFHWHFHPEVELVWIESGEGLLHAGQTLIPYEAGQLVLIGSNLPHAYGSAPTQRTGARWTVLHFRPSLWGAEFWKLPENSRILALLERAGRGYLYSNQVATEAAKYLAHIQNPTPGDMPLARLLNLLDLLARDNSGHQLNPQSISGGNIEIQDTRLQFVLSKLEQTSHEPGLTQAEAAQWLNMTPPAFCRYFKRLTGRKFQHHLNQLRISRACANLLSTEKSITEVAYESGFNNLSNFNRRFREFTNHTPRSYRRTKGGLIPD
ncbi:helix-turn-helix transcriptional regulator [Coraliomargarita sp. SDUM461004]|uniref:Helix-turn-helix transcriptional regulator n=1 Tax=Thalassobacterium sedimentorum TaxID=3041258 RepID=A0ABU1AIY0_9BACT|nr:helix-turn-helix transcriptional regulator [Coraliomargarita sp. SDUM461004]MDQ8194771.1 helix-turn-helix transcriptional regulator [Coraliomargarita sp. SDUM461004]